jgi:hypothetical protein
MVSPLAILRQLPSQWLLAYALPSQSLLPSDFHPESS